MKTIYLLLALTLIGCSGNNLCECEKETHEWIYTTGQNGEINSATDIIVSTIVVDCQQEIEYGQDIYGSTQYYKIICDYKLD